jgi:hypothetical protein
MIGNIETLTKLGCEIKDGLATDVTLQSLPMSYESFIMNFHMNVMEKTVAELDGMLKTVEDSIKKNPNHVMMNQKEKKKRKRWAPPKGKGKEKISNEPSSSKPQTKGKSGPSPDEECFHCHKKGHWFRNYKKYLEEQKKKKGSETSASGINGIEINIAISSSDSWVFDTGSMIHTCKSLQGRCLTRGFAKGELDVLCRQLSKGCSHSSRHFPPVVILRISLRIKQLLLHSYFMKNIISSTCLEEADGYEIIIKNKCCSIYYNSIFYDHCPLVNGLYVLDLEDKYVYNINVKRARLNDLNSTFIWHLTRVSLVYLEK